MSYVPLWVRSNYSFLQGASHPAELMEAAVGLGIPAIALTDRDGVYGIVQAHASTAAGTGGRSSPRLIVGSEITLEDGRSVVLLAQNREGYARLCSLITAGRMRSPKGSSTVTVPEIAAHAEELLALWTGHCPDATGRRARNTATDRARVPEAVAEAFRDRLYVAVSRHDDMHEAQLEPHLRAEAQRLSAPLVAAPRVLYHDAPRRRLYDTLTCIRHGVSLDEAGTLLPPNERYVLPTTAEMMRRYADGPQLVRRTVEVAERCSFSLDEIEYRYPSEALPDGYTTSEWLWELTFSGARKRYGGTIPADVRTQLRKELSLIDELHYCGYFLTMWEIVEYCRRHGILCQGRGSAANSAVCYCLGITAVDPVRMDLLFERFLSRERAEPPDIDVDIEHRRREEVIQHMYQKYGRDRAAMVANVIRYRVKSALRDVGKVLSLPATALDRMAKLASSRDSNLVEVMDAAGLGERTRRLLTELTTEILHFPRHLSIHPGGFLLGSEPVARIVPTENATMPDRTVIQWDKCDVEEMGLFKVDLLGLGALTHLDYCFALLRRHKGIELTMATIPHEDAAVFRMITAGDTVGVFQLESRAQMAMLPRLKPVTWYDLVIEVSIVRPGPITGGMVHPYLRRRAGLEPVVYPHPALEPVLKKTLGVPIFQEQVMKLAVVAADYTPGEADQLRRDMAAWRRSGRMEKHRERLVERMVAKGIEPEFAEAVFQQILGFGEYGFPESHAAGFSLIAYCTAWMRVHHPAVFVCGLLNAWPMGFYSPATIVEDAKRHGICVLPVDVLHSDWDCTLSPASSPATPSRGSVRHAVRMGLRYIKGLGEDDYGRIVRARGNTADGSVPFSGIDDFVARTRLREDLLVALSRAGAFGSLGLSRRDVLWAVTGTAVHGRAARTQDHTAPHWTDTEAVPEFAHLSDFELVAWDYQTAGHSVSMHPLEPHREALSQRGYPTAAEVEEIPDGRSATYVGMVICRQRPETAGGTLFMTLEDESGFVNLVIWKDVLAEYRTVILTSAILGVRGRVQNEDGVTHLIVDSCFKPRLLDNAVRVESRDFR